MTPDQYRKADDCLRKLHLIGNQIEKLEIATKKVMESLKTPAEQRVWDYCGYEADKMLKVQVPGSYYLPISDADILRLLEEEKIRLEAEMEKQEKIFESI
ncbi:MAG: hypothetical protein RR382_08195 [Tannerellaceae bacterium]